MSWTMGVMLLTSLAGCGSMPKFYGGKIIPEKNLIVLKNGGPHENKWANEDVIINYTYTRNDGRLEISGTIDFDDRLKYNFDNLDYFDLWIYFTNSENKIIGHLLVSPMTFLNQIEEMDFNKTYVLPPTAKAMVFSYRGSVHEGGGSGGDNLQDGGSTWTFWKPPHS